MTGYCCLAAIFDDINMQIISQSCIHTENPKKLFYSYEIYEIFGFHLGVCYLGTLKQYQKSSLTT